MAISLIPDDQLLNIAKNTTKKLEYFKRSYELNEIRDYELVGFFILTLQFEVYSNKWKGSSSKNQKSLASQSHFLASKVHPSLPPIQIIDFFKTYRLRGISVKAQDALVKWAEGMYPLILKFQIPSSLEVLELQAQGKRVLTLPIDFENYHLPVHDGRDCLSFIIHDLMHAHCFFSNPNQKSEQIYFYRMILKLLETNILKDQIQDSEFIEDFDYLISDMNSVSLHLMKCFKTILLNFYLKSQKEHPKLTPENEQIFQNKLKEIYDFWKMDLNTKQSFLALNTPHFCNKKEGQIVTDFFLNS